MPRAAACRFINFKMRLCTSPSCSKESAREREAERERGRQETNDRRQVGAKRRLMELPGTCAAEMETQVQVEVEEKLVLTHSLSIPLSSFALLLSGRGLLSRDAANDKSKSHSNATRRAAEVNAKNFCPTISQSAQAMSVVGGWGTPYQIFVRRKKLLL